MPLTLVPAPAAAAAAGAHTTPPFACTSTVDGTHVAFVHVAGQLDTATSPQLERELMHPGLQARLVVLDLRAVTFVDRSGVHAIVDASVQARRASRRIVILRGPPAVDRAFALIDAREQAEIIDLDTGSPPVQAILRLVAADSDDGQRP